MLGSNWKRKRPKRLPRPTSKTPDTSLVRSKGPARGTRRTTAGRVRRVPLAGPSILNAGKADVRRPGSREPGEAGKREGYARVIALCQPAGKGGADRGRAEEDDRVEGHYPAAHLGGDRQLQGGVDRCGEGDGGGSQDGEHDYLQGEAWHCCRQEG